MSLSDYIDRYRSSDCCDAPIMGFDMCSECGEHCEDAKDEEEESE